MRLLLLCLAMLTWPLSLSAQQDDRGFIQGLLEDALSSEGFTVRLEGFAGALSSRATVERITVADGEGVWLSAEDVGLQWNRSALTRGRVDIEEISMQTLSLTRLPQSQGAAPTPEARSPFALPDLPVSIELGQLSVARVELGEAVIGEAAALSVNGTASLSGGEGQAQLDIQRLDRGGTIAFNGSYSNSSRILGVDLQVREPEDGLAVTLLGIPGAPSVALDVQGNSPIDDFEANVRLATDGAERLAGSVILRANGDADTRQFRVDIGGDLAPVVPAQFRQFLGNEVGLVAEVVQEASGAIELSELDLRAEALRLTGYARVGADGWPERLDLSGEITPPQGDRVVLPIAGPVTSVSGVRLNGRFNAAEGNGWQITARADNVLREGMASLERLDLTGAGEIAREAGRVSGVLDVNAAGLDLTADTLAQAVGQQLRGRVGFDWQNGAPLFLREIDLAGEDYGLTGNITLSAIDTLNPIVAPDLRLRADNLSRFAALAGIALDGAAALSIEGQAEPTTGAFDITLDGTTRDLETGIEPVDVLIDGVGALRLEARRDETGLYAEVLRVTTATARIDGTAALISGAGQADLDVTLNDTSVLLPGLSGETQLALTAQQQDTTWQVDLTGTIPDTARLRWTGTVETDTTGGPRVAGTLDGNIARLSPFSELAGRDLSGAAELFIEGQGRVGAQTFDARINAKTTNLALGIPSVDPILTGVTDLSADIARGADGRFVLTDLRYDGIGTARLDGSVSGASVQDLAVDGRITANLPSLAPLSGVAGRSLRGAASVDITANGALMDGPLDLTGNATTRDVSLSIPAVDPLLRGTTRLDVSATRNAQGTYQIARLTVDGVLNASFNGTAAGTDRDTLRINGRLQGDVPSLAPLSGLSGQRLAGSLRFDADIAVEQPDGPVAVDGNLLATGLRLGNPSLDPFLAGTTRVDLNVDRSAGGALRIERFTVDGSSIDGSVTGQLAPSNASLNLNVTVAGIERLVPDLPGSVRISGTAGHSGGDWRVNLDGSGPGGIGLAVNGTASQNFRRLNLDLNGSAPLALANGRLAPQVVTGVLNFDLALRGAPALSSLSGQLSTSGARFSAPAYDITLQNLDGGVTLSGGRAQVGLTGNLNTGGQIAVSGPVTLSAPYRANLLVELRNAALRQAGLFETTANGRVTIEGPLTGGARIAGQIDLGQVEVRIPNIGPSYSALDGLRHVQPPADVQRTLQFANLGPRSDANEGASLPPYPLDLVINAPNRIFVRGRGLDAELGGRLRLTGTSANITPVGQFDLIRGRLDLLGRRLDLTDAAVFLRGSFDPYISFEAASQVEDVEILIRIEGPATEPDLVVTSSPELPEDEALAFFLFGRSVTELSALQAVQLAAAVRTLSGQGGLGLTDNIRNELGVDNFDIGTSEDGTIEASVGKYISDNVYTDVTVDADGQSKVNLNLNLTDNVTVRGRVSSDGTSGLGVFFEKDY